MPRQELTQLKRRPRLRDDAIKVIPPAWVGIFARSAGVARNGFLVSKPRLLGVKSRCPPSLPLAEQIPALVQHDLDPLESDAVGVICGPVRLPLKKFVLFSRKLIDVVLFRGQDIRHAPLREDCN